MSPEDDPQYFEEQRLYWQEWLREWEKPLPPCDTCKGNGCEECEETLVCYGNLSHEDGW